MESPTVIIPNNSITTSPPLMTYKILQSAKFAFNDPFRLQFEDGEIFYAEETVRLLPKRRIVAFGTWQNRKVVAKCFFDEKDAKKHQERELAGIHLLTESKIPIPQLYYQGVTRERQIYVLIFERLDGKNLETILQEKNHQHLPLLQTVVIELATQHVMGLKQHDLHLKNFFVVDNRLYTLDGGQVEKFPTILSKNMSIEHLGLFLSQLGVGMKEEQQVLFEHYAKARGWQVKNEDIHELFLFIKRINKERWNKFSKKIFRECTDFAPLRNGKVEGMYARQYAQREFLEFLQNPELAFHHERAQALKTGRSSTVIKIKLDGNEFVVKRYNVKNLWHGMRRYLRTTRAKQSWRLGLKLSLFGINTAKPAAYLETKVLGLSKQAYYVTEYVRGDHAGLYFEQNHDKEKISTMTKRIVHLFKNLWRMGLTHGDLKITNILIDDSSTPFLIDLDGMCEHTSLSSLNRGWKKDWQRFLKNFSANPELHKHFQEEWRKQ